MAPNSLITPLLQKSIYQTKADLIILDGYPRSLEQLDIIKSIIPKNKLSFVFRDTPEQIIKERIKNRRICSDCGMPHISSEGACCCGGKLIRRHDDLLIDDRLNEYRIVTIPMIEKLKESFRIYTFQGSNIADAKLKAFVNTLYADNKNNICNVIKTNEGK